jgi:hypothetical protein
VIAAFKAQVADAARRANYRPKRYTRIRFQYHNNVKPRRQSHATDAASTSPEWFTPPRVFEVMGVEFDMDPASPGADIVPWIPAKQHLTRAEDGLTTPWEGFVWCNPSYGVRNGMQKWIDKFVVHGNGVILLPGYTYTKWFHDFMSAVDLILFPLFKLNFISPRLPAGRNATLSNCLAASGEQGQAALRNAAASGFGKLFIPEKVFAPRNWQSGSIAAITETSDGRDEIGK